MPTISDPDYPQCSVDCPGTGYAYFVPLYGPCLKGCDPDGFLRDAHSLFRERDHGSFRFSGTARAIPGMILARLAVEIRDIAPSYTEDEREWLEYLATSSPNVPFSFTWKKATLAGFLEILAETTGRPRAAAAGG